MQGVTIRFIDRHVGRGDILLGKCRKPIRCITGRYDVVDTYSTARCSNPGRGELVSFSAPVQNGPQAHPVYRPMGTGSSWRTVAGGWRGYRVFRAYSGRRMAWVPGLPGEQWPEDGDDHPHSSSAQIIERIELHSFCVFKEWYQVNFSSLLYKS